MDRRTLLTLAAASAIVPLASAQTRTDGAQVARSLAALIDLEYPDPPAAAALAATLRVNARAGRYRGLAPEALAERLTGDLRAGIPDQHLEVSYAPDEASYRSRISPDAPVPESPTPHDVPPRAREIFAPENYGIAGVRRLPGNIGLIEVDNFTPLYEAARQRYGAAMSLIQDTWALIIDLRNNGGGHADTTVHLISYFFDREPFVFGRMVWRRLPEEESRTTRNMAGPNYGETRPVFVTTSHQTMSAAEAVAYTLQSFGRARILGEVSRGGANPGDFFNIGQGFVAFVPQGRGYNVITGTNWEGVGVQPDIVASAADAVTAAHRAAIEAALAQTSDPTRQRILREAIEGG